MISEKLFIPGKDQKKICLLIEKPTHPHGLAIIMHGLGGFKEQDHLQIIAESFSDQGITVVRFDTRNTFGESEGNYEHANTTNYYEDLESVITHLKKQPGYQGPFYLIGHSMGGLCVAIYAENHPEEIKGLAPLSTVISGDLTLQREAPERVKEWNASGWKISPSTSKPGIMKKLRWHQFIDDLKKYDLLPHANKLTMPVLLITGEHDHGTPAEDQRLLYDRLAGEKELHVIKGAPHTFRDTEHLREIKNIFEDWILRIESGAVR